MSRGGRGEPPSEPLSPAEEAYLAWSRTEPWSVWSEFTAEERRALTWFDGWHAALNALEEVRAAVAAVVTVLECECEALTESDDTSSGGRVLALVPSSPGAGEEPTDKP